MKKYIYPLAITAAMLATTACSDDVVNDVVENKPDSQKEMIAFTSEDAFGSVTTRSGNTRAGFTGANTDLVMHIVSTNGTASLFTKTLATAQKNTSTDESAVSAVSFTDAYKRYWDDAYGRNAKLSVYAVAVPDKKVTDTGAKLTESSLASTTNTWDTESSTKHEISWSVTSDQNVSTVEKTGDKIMAEEDLVFSNNISESGLDGRYVGFSTTDHSGDGYLQFNQTDGTTAGTFEKGHLIFTHALTRIVVNFVEGEGFDKTSSTKDNDFKFDDGKTPLLINMPISGSLDLPTGKWTIPATSPEKKTVDNVKMFMQPTANTGAEYTYLAQVLPNYEISKTGTANVLEFSIDGNVYNVTQAMVYTALETQIGVTAASDKIVLERGKRYNLKLTVNKSDIKLTASLVDWTDVNAAAQNKDNAVALNITLHEKISNSKYDKDFDLYRLYDSNEQRNWTTDYITTSKSDKQEMTKTDNGEYTPTNWYYENSTIGYHFRIVNKGTSITSNSSTGDTFTMEAGAQSTNDYRWGAPFLTATANDLKYDTDNGWANQISPAIGANSGTINIIGFHMMSNVDVILKTPEAPATNNNSVVLYKSGETPSGCKVEFVNVSTSATVKMGTGLVTAATAVAGPVAITSPSLTSTTDYYQTSVTVTKPFTYAFVPQTLADNAGIKITTPDGNVYNVESLKDVLVSGSETDKITEWLPNHHYVYTFTLTKTGINTMTASLVDWTTVNATDIPIDLEK